MPIDGGRRGSYGRCTCNQKDVFMKAHLPKLFLSILTAGLLFSQAPLADDKALTKSDVEAIVKQVIKDNPEILIESVQGYQKKKAGEDLEKASKAIVDRKAELTQDSVSPSVGNPKGDVTIIEFFDYHCGYCKQFLPVVSQLVSEDPKLRVVFKEFPILSEDSNLAAKAALAVNSIDKSKYLAYHTALMKSTGQFSQDTLTDKAVAIGIDREAFRKALASPEIDKELSKNRELASALYITGTPAIVIGEDLIPGVIPLNDLKKRVEAARAKAK